MDGDRALVATAMTLPLLGARSGVLNPAAKPKAKPLGLGK